MKPLAGSLRLYLKMRESGAILVCLLTDGCCCTERFPHRDAAADAGVGFLELILPFGTLHIIGTRWMAPAGSLT